MSMSAWPIVLGLVVAAVPMSACHRFYEIRGSVQVAPSAVRRARLPSVLCTGTGGALEKSLVHGRPAGRSQQRDPHPTITVFCSEPQVAEAFPLLESIYYGSLPRQAHVYAWLAPIAAAEPLCVGFATGTVEIDGATMYRLKLEVQDSTRRSDPTWPCGNKPPKGAPTTFAVTFDPEHKSWEEDDGGRWIERRILYLQ
jgi:hypothetical protein